MKNITLLCISIISIAAVLLVPGTVDRASAAGGCCMQRSGGRWHPNGMNFNQCSEANRYHDRNDNLYEPVGDYWWNVNC